MYQNDIVIRRMGAISSQPTDATGTARAIDPGYKSTERINNKAGLNEVAV